MIWFALVLVEDCDRLFRLIYDRLSAADVAALLEIPVCFQWLRLNDPFRRSTRYVIAMGLLGRQTGLGHLDGLSELVASVLLEGLLMGHEVDILVRVSRLVGRQIMIDANIHGNSVRLVSSVDGFAATLGGLQIGGISKSSLEVYH